MPCHPHRLTQSFVAWSGTALALLIGAAAQGAVERREAACGIAADNLLTDRETFTVFGEPVSEVVPLAVELRRRSNA
jgi:hypothetical protein